MPKVAHTELDLHVLHEVHSQAHRIVVVSPAGTKQGPWASLNKVAMLEGWFATTGQYPDDLPGGVFRCSAVAHKTLNG